jgi:hypothetical protein
MFNDPNSPVDWNRILLEEMRNGVRDLESVEALDGLRRDLTIVDAHIALICRDCNGRDKDRIAYDAMRIEMIATVDAKEKSIRDWDEELARILGDEAPPKRAFSPINSACITLTEQVTMHTDGRGETYAMSLNAIHTGPLNPCLRTVIAYGKSIDDLKDMTDGKVRILAVQSVGRAFKIVGSQR